MAMCPLLKSKCRQLLIGHQCLPFTPALAEALGKSACLDKLVFDEVTFDNKVRWNGLLFAFAKIQALRLFD
jgi:hypothetical protein